MKKSKIKAKDFINDLESILEIVDKIDNLDPEKTDLPLLAKIIKDKVKFTKNKYKYLDSQK